MIARTGITKEQNTGSENICTLPIAERTVDSEIFIVAGDNLARCKQSRIKRSDWKEGS